MFPSQQLLKHKCCALLLFNSRIQLMQTKIVTSNNLAATRQQVRWLSQEQKDKQFVDAPTPYQKAKRCCILCKNNIKLDYKNPRLLSQFVSPLNGNIYDKHITGLCETQQKVLESEIKLSRRNLLMPIYYKDPKYNKDPPLFNPDRPQRPNPY